MVSPLYFLVKYKEDSYFSFNVALSFLLFQFFRLALVFMPDDEVLINTKIEIASSNFGRLFSVGLEHSEHCLLRCK